jgi:hypothetical protein
MLMTRFCGAAVIGPLAVTCGTRTDMFRSVSENFVPTMKKITNRNITSIIDVKFIDGCSSESVRSGIVWFLVRKRQL